MRLCARMMIAALVLMGPAALGQSAPSKPDLEFFEKSIRPLFAERCYECHGVEEQESGLRLDHISTILKGGERGPAITPGDPEESNLVIAVTYEDADLQMPPKVMLEDEEIDLLIRWVEMGAPWPAESPPEDVVTNDEVDVAKRKAEHWAWQPEKKDLPPTLLNAEWPINEVDRFILSRLEREGLRPGGEADRRTLVRRLYFDLLGLPPTPKEIDEFLTDSSTSAYEHLVDRVLASPHFGERWGRHWLDLVRFAESYGHEADFPIREAWRYRDYVIRSLNADIPYDEFVREHIAGDLLNAPRMHPKEGYNESVIGTGWWYMHQATHAPVDVEKDEADRIDNQIDVMSKAFLGMTVACARCHDHKFDAITSKDYYSLSAFLRGSRQHFAYLDPKGKIAASVKTLEDIQSDGSAKLGRTLERISDDSAAQTREYLMASREVLYGEPVEDGKFASVETLVFADFEDGSYDEWKIEGDAFGDSPATGTLENQQEVSGFEGQGLVNTFLNGDGATGTLTSPEFKISQPYIHFLIAGGKHPAKTCVNLLVNGKVVRRQTGRNNERLLWRTWEVTGLQGKQARLQIVDKHKGGWGHVNIDQITFSDLPVAGSIPRSVGAVAQEYQLDATRLGRWVRILQSEETREKSHPLYAWSQLSRAHKSDFDKKRIRLANDSSDIADSSDVVVFESFDAPGYGEWFVTGEAFGRGPTQTGDWSPGEHGAGFVGRGVAHSGRLSSKLRGTLRSPTFILNHDSIHYRVKGHKSQIRLIIGRYQLREFNGILFQDTYVDADSDEFVWHHQVGGLQRWKGIPAYIEIIDDDDGYIAVDEIRFSDRPPGAVPMSKPIREDLRSRAPDSLESLAGTYADWTRNSLQNWGKAGLDADSSDWLNLLWQEQLLDFGRYEKHLSKLSERIAAVEANLPNPLRVPAITDGTLEESYVFIRGNHGDRGEDVERRFLEAIDAGNDPIEGPGSGRLALAERITSDNNPLFSRVMTNRIWHHLFGRGIVSSVDNFGVLGARPSHPELLDYLALRFREDGYSIKSMIRLLATSRTYRMSSVPGDEVAEKRDPNNIMLHRASLRRLESEAIRDAILATAGTLDRKMFGPSVKAYLSPSMTYHRRPGKSGPMDGDRRRTIYTEVKRNFLSEMQLAFDLPLPDSTTGRRTVSNVPAQSLIMMNDPFVAEQARALGAVLSSDSGTLEGRLMKLCESAWGRPPSTEEQVSMMAFIKQQGAEYGIEKADAERDPRIWSDLVQVLFMAKEFIFIG